MKIVLPYNVHKRIMFYVNNCDKEIGGMGRIKFDKNKNEYTVLSVCLPTQEVGSAHTDLDADSVAQCELASINDEGWFNFWWHSHVNMQAFWSGTDTATIKEMGKQGLCVAVVFNKKRECRGAVYARSEAEHVPDWFNDNIPVEWKEEPCAMNEVWLSEIKNNVRERKPYHHSLYGTKGELATNKNLYQDMWLDEDYAYLNRAGMGNAHGIRQYTGTSNAFKKEVKNLLKLCQKDKRDYLIFLKNNLKFSCVELSNLTRDAVQDIIDANPSWTQAERIELMSKWYLIPYTFSIEGSQTILSGADI
jgi:hypothetical protein